MNRILVCVCVVGARMFLGGLSTVLAIPGDLDPTFGQNGIVLTDFSNTSDAARAMILQPDGKIVLAGNIGAAVIALARYTPDGALDPSFGGDGKVMLSTGETIYGNSIALQQDGKIVVAGSMGQIPNSDFFVARFHPDGTVDSGFDGDGWVTTDFVNSDDQISEIEIQPDGKIVAAGSIVGPGNDIGLARYNTEGSLDESFGSGGRVITDLGTTAFGSALVLQPDGKIVVAGSTNDDYVVLRYNTDGSLDSSFSFDGKVITDISGTTDRTTSVALQEDGKIVVAGNADLSDSDFGVARYNPDGSLDTNFSSDGILRTDFDQQGDSAYDVVWLPDGKIIVVGSAATITTDFALARYNSDGSLDTSFHFDGRVTTDLTGSGDVAQSAVLSADGKIVVAGSAFSGTLDFAIARYLNDVVAPPPPECLFCDDFEDAVLADDWTYSKPSWTETAGNVTGTPLGRAAEAVASPAFDGCYLCSVRATMSTAGGIGNRLTLLAWYVNKNNTLEVIMKEEFDKWILRQKSGGLIIAKTRASRPIVPGVSYDVQVQFDGDNFTLIVDGSTIAGIDALVSPAGTVGFRVKNTIGTFGSITVN